LRIFALKRRQVLSVVSCVQRFSINSCACRDKFFLKMIDHSGYLLVFQSICQ
jgi:hypothetical protein